MKTPHVIVCALAVALSTAYASEAHATSIGGSVGYGTAGGDPNAFGLGFLGRVGFGLPLNLYVGGNFVYYLGTTNELAGVKFSQNTWYAGGEVGYDIDQGDFVIRPVVGIGGLVLRSKTCVADLCSTHPSATSFYVAPGVYGQYDIGPAYVGANIRYVIPTAMTRLNSFGFFGSVGVNL